MAAAAKLFGKQADYEYYNALSEEIKQAVNDKFLNRETWCTLDSPVNYSAPALRIPEGAKFSLEFPGAPDTVRWHIGQSGAPDQGAFGCHLAPLFEPFLLIFYWLMVNL